MADGDKSKILVSKIRTDLGDEAHKLIRTDDMIYRKLSSYQMDWSKRYKCIKEVIQFDLVANQETYPLESKVVSINNLSYNFSYSNKPIITEITKHDTRQIQLSGSDLFEAGNVMYADAYIQATDDDAISRTNDPIIGEDYHELLVKAVLSEYIYLRKDFMPLTEVERRVKDTAYAALAINRAVLRDANFGPIF